MSLIGIGYEAHTEPNPISFNVTMGVSGTEVQATIGDVSPFVAILKPTGNVAGVVLSGAAWPLAQTIGVVLPPLATQIVHTLPRIRVASIEPTTEHIDGETFIVTPSNLALTEWDGMLMISGEIGVT